MIRKAFSTFIFMSLLAGCTSQSVKPERTVAMGDTSGYVRTVNIKPKDLRSVCNFDNFQEGFRYTYMSMWNGRIDKILESSPTSNVTAYYKGKFFYSKPNTKAALDANPRDRDGYNECQEASYQQGKMNGFIYSLEDLKGLEESAPK
jgi:hypothetical protein